MKLALLLFSGLLAAQSWHLEPIAYQPANQSAATPTPTLITPVGDGACQSVGPKLVQCGRFLFQLVGQEISLVGLVKPNQPGQQHQPTSSRAALLGPSSPSLLTVGFSSQLPLLQQQIWPPVTPTTVVESAPVQNGVVIRASKLPSSAMRGLSGGLVTGASLFEGNACLLPGAPTMTVTMGQIFSALVGKGMPVISRGSAQAATNYTRGKKVAFALGFAQVGPSVGQAAVALAATRTVNISSQWVAGISLASWGLQTLMEATRAQREAAVAPLTGLWLEDLPSMELNPNAPCTPLFRYMSTFRPGMAQTVSAHLD